MIDANDYKHECPAGCDCPDSYDPYMSSKVRSIAGRALTLLERSDPYEFLEVWEHSNANAHLRLTIDNYHIVAGVDRWIRIHRINVDNVPGQLTVFSAWLYKHSSEGLNYHMGPDEEIDALESWLEQKFVLDDLARLE